MFNRHSILPLLCVMAMALVANPSWAAKGGGWSLGGSLGISSSSQDHINYLISQANTNDGPISTGQLGSAWELYGFLQYRFSGSWLAFQFRPSFFYQNSSGTNSGGQKFEFGVQSYTIFPVARFYMLESKYIRFFSQLGIGVGMATGELSQPDWSAKFSGASMGYMFGLGAEFCFMGGPHCMVIEGNFRYLPVDRLTVDSSTGTASNGASQIGSGQELEIDGSDMGVTMSGIQGFLGYAFNF